jgi:hypothetical protein
MLKQVVHIVTTGLQKVNPFKTILTDRSRELSVQ